MNVKVSYQNFSSSPWMEQVLERRLDKIDHLLSPTSKVNVHCRYDNKAFVTTLSIRDFHQDFAFNAMADDLVESINQAVLKARRSLGEKKQKVKDHIHRRFISLKKQEIPT